MYGVIVIFEELVCIYGLRTPIIKFGFFYKVRTVFKID